jgi:hypothetical protein
MPITFLCIVMSTKAVADYKDKKVFARFLIMDFKEDNV